MRRINQARRSSPFAVREALSFHPCLDEVGAISLHTYFFAGRFDSEALADRSVAEASGHTVVEQFEVFVFKFDDFSAIDADKVVVCRAIEEVRVVGGLAVAELDFVNESGFVEQGESAVDGGSGSCRSCRTEAVEELFRSEMFVGSKDDVDDFIALRGLPKTFFNDELV